VQVTLGALTVLSQKQFIINSLHVVNGALVLVTSLVLTLRAHYFRFAGSAAAFAERNPAHVRGAGSTLGDSQRAWTRQNTRGASA